MSQSLVKNYIQNQEEHHRTVSFHDELRELFRLHEIEFDERGETNRLPFHQFWKSIVADAASVRYSTISVDLLLSADFAW